MTESNEPSNFTTAIECLEAGDLARAEKLFNLTIKKLGPAHNQSHLSYKSLISIATENGEYGKALTVSLDLLDAQINTFGIRHAETSRTINNIYTLCNTLGKHELAREIMQMAKDAEQQTVASSVKKLRGDQEELPEEEEEKIELPGAQTMIGKITQPVNSLFDIMGKRLKRVVCVTILLALTATIFGTLFAFKTMEKSGSGGSTMLSMNNYSSADGRVSLDFGKNGKAQIKIDQKSLALPTRYYKNPSQHFASLLLSPVNSRELWIFKTPQGIDGVGNCTLFADSNEEMHIVAMMKKVTRVSNRWFQDEKKYPETLHTEEIRSMFEFENAFTLRTDYPIVQQLQLPDERFTNINQLLSILANGGTWTNEASLYPGAINCLHVTAETENSFIEKFIVHGCDRYGQIIRDASGRSFTLVSSGGHLERSTGPVPASVTGASSMAIIDQSMGGMVLLLKYRLTIFYLGLSLLYLALAKLLPDGLAKILAGLCSFGFFAVSIIAALIWYLPI